MFFSLLFFCKSSRPETCNFIVDILIHELLVKEETMMKYFKLTYFKLQLKILLKPLTFLDFN